MKLGKGQAKWINEHAKDFANFKTAVKQDKGYSEL